MARTPCCQREARRNDHRRQAGYRHGAGQRAEPGKIGGGEDAEHAGNRARGFGVDALDRRVRVRRADHLHPALAGDVDILDVVAAPGQEARIFKARQ